jgi:hypothetical protein
MYHEIIDNFLPNNIFSELKNILMSPEYPWFYQSSVTNGKHQSTEPYYFANLLYDGCHPQPLYHLCLPILDILKPKSLIRIKTNLYPNIGRYIENENHTDYDFPHNGAILYVNTNDGYTILEDGTKIDSVANRLLKFDPSKPHRSTHCTDQKVRVNINFNYF